MKPLSMGTQPVPSPQAHTATSLGGHALAQRAVGDPGMEALSRPRRAGCSGQQLPPLEDWGEHHPPHVRGPRLPFPGLSTPTTLTRTAKAPLGGGVPD